jgi:superfamily I DNA/RNA helicase
VDFSFDDDYNNFGSRYKIIPNIYEGECKSKLNILLDSLDEYQRDIVLDKSINSPLKVMASAGSGKTQCLLAKALKMYLIDRVDPTSIVLITFTNKAANEIKERYLNFFRNIMSEGEVLNIPIPHISTIHSFSCSMLYKMFGIRRTILSESHIMSLLKSVILEVFGVKKIEKSYVRKINEIISAIHSNNELHYFFLPIFNRFGGFEGSLDLCNMSEDEKELFDLIDNFSYNSIEHKLGGEYLKREEIIKRYAKLGGISSNQLTKILESFLIKKYLSNTIDFSDMQYLTFIILNQHSNLLQDIWKQYKYFVIDESQDMNVLEFSLVVTCDQDSYTRFLR